MRSARRFLHDRHDQEPAVTSAVTPAVVPIDPDACAVRIIDHDKVAAAQARMIPDAEA